MTVKQIQHLLAYLGYYGGTADGDWGAMSRAACTAFQKDWGLTADGIAGQETQQALKHGVTYGITGNGQDSGDFWGEIRHFTREEFRCQCGGRFCGGFPAEPQENMVRLADRAREHFGRPAYVVSGLRCRQHNANVGGVANSQHLYGEACDLQIPGVSGDTLLAWFRAQPGVRYAYKIEGSENVHFDIPKGAR